MSEISPPGTLTRSLPPGPRSAAAARRLVRAALEGVAPDTVHTAQLLVSELVTNAVLHARTEIEVSVRHRDRGVQLRVGDHRPSRPLVRQALPPHAGTALGLTVVEQLASRYGIDTDGERKTAWCELWPREPAPDPSRSGTEAPSRSETAVPSSGRRGTVFLIDLPGALYLASQQHRHALLRELTLAAAAGNHLGVRPDDLLTARDVHNLISAAVSAALENQPAVAHIHSLQLSMPLDAAEALHTLCRVLARAEQAARDGHLLTWPALPPDHRFDGWLLDQISGQLTGEDPTAWTVVPREPSAGSSELAPWEAGHIWSSRVPTIAADDTDRIIAANGPAADLLGWQADDLVGQPLTALIPGHLRDRHRAAFSSLLLTGRPRILGRSVPLPALHRDGRLVPVRLFVQTQPTADGRRVFVAQLTPRTAPPEPAPRTAEEERSAALQEPSGLPPPDLPEGVTRERGGEGAVSALERLSLLADTGGALSSTPDLGEKLRRACRILNRRLSDWCVVDLLTDQRQVERVCVVHPDPAAIPADAYVGGLPPVSESAQGPLARALRGAGPLLLTRIPPPSEADNPLDARQLELFRHMGATSALIAPLRARQTVFGALTVARTDAARPFTEEERSLIDDLVHGLAVEVDNARLHQETQDISERLQRSLLPRLPDIAHLRLAARYAPSSATAQVGGDWYDCFLVPGGETALVIGDVAGHDLDAAVTMSQLRNMLRGIAVDRQEPPGEVLRRLDRANHTLNHEATATCIYALVHGPEAGPWEFRHSSAGHLPPLLTTAEGDTRYLEDGAGLLLGMDPAPARPEARAPLPAHSTVLLYTDGLIERRDASLDDSLAELRRHTAALAREPLDVFCDELLIGLGADNADDIAVLAVRPTPPD